MATAGISNDITLAVTGGTAVGFNIARDKNRRKLYKVGYAPMLSPQYAAEQPTAENIPIEQEILFQQTSFHAGMSEKRVAKGTSKIYDAVYGDTRWKGKLMLPPLITAITSTARHTPQNPGFETAVSGAVSNWTATDALLAQGTILPQAGTYTGVINSKAFQWKEHRYSASNGSAITFSKPSSSIIRMTFANNVGAYVDQTEALLFYIADRVWLNGKTLEVLWDGTKGTAGDYSATITVYDGSYDRTSATDFPDAAGMATKGAGLLQTIATKTETFESETATATIDTSGGSQRFCTIFIRLQLTQQPGQGGNYLNVDTVTIKSGATTLFSQAFDGTLTTEVTGDDNDYGYIETKTGNIKQTCYMRGLAVTFTCYIKTTLSSHIRLGLTDSTDTTYSSYHTGGGAWEQLTVTKTLALTSTTETFDIYIDSATAGLLGFLPGDVDTAAATVNSINYAGIKFMEHKTTMLLLLTKALCKWDNTNAWWEVLRGAGTNNFTNVESFDGNLYLTHGNGYTFEVSTDDGVTWADSNLGSNVDFDFFRAYANNLWGFTKPNELRTSANPVNGGTVFGTLIEIGDTSWNINGIAALGAAVYVGKENGVFKIDATPAVTELLPEFRTLQDANNFKGMLSWQGFIFLPTKNSLYVYDGTTITEISPPKYMSDVSASRFQGQFSILAGDTSWLYVATTTGGLFAVRQETVEGEVPQTEWRWHVLYDLATTLDDSGNAINPIDCMFVSKLQAIMGRLWIWGESNSAYKSFYITLSGSTSPDKSSGTFGYKSTTDSAIYLPAWDYGFPQVNKAFLQCDITASGLSGDGTGVSDIWVQIKYSIDGGTATTLGNITASTSTLYFGSTATGKKINLIFNLKRGASAATTTTPIITAIVIHALFKPTPRRMWAITVELARNPSTLSGARTTELPATIASNLKTLLEATWPLTFVDVDGTSWSVQLLPQSYSEDPYLQEDDDEKRRERTASFTLLEAKTA